MISEDEYFKAVIRDGLHNARTNPAVAADTQYAPVPITAAEEAEYVRRQYGSDSERIARLIREHNTRNK